MMPGGGLVVSVRLGPELSGEFAEFCERNRVVNRSEFVRRLIVERMGADALEDKHGRGLLGKSGTRRGRLDSANLGGGEG